MYYVKSSQPFIEKAVLLTIATAAAEALREETKQKATEKGGRLNFIEEMLLENYHQEALKFSEKEITDHTNHPVNLDAIAGIEADETMKEKGIAVIDFHGAKCVHWKYTDLQAFEHDWAALQDIIERESTSL